MWLLILIAFFCLFLCWLLVAPVTLEIDTVNALAAFRWLGIGAVRIWFEDEWMFSIQLFFFHKTIPFSKMQRRAQKTTATKKRKQKKKARPKSILKRVIQVIRTLKITEWQLAIDSGRYDLNARLYPLNFLSCTSGHLFINYQNKNFLMAKLRGRPWKIVYAFIK